MPRESQDFSDGKIYLVLFVIVCLSLYYSEFTVVVAGTQPFFSLPCRFLLELSHSLFTLLLLSPLFFLLFHTPLTHPFHFFSIIPLCE